MQSNPQRIMDSLRRIVQALRQSTAHSQRSSNLTGAQALVIKHVGAHGGLSINDLAALTFTHQSTVSEVVGRLESRGLILRERARDDGRRCELRLSAKGESVARNAPITAQESLMQALKQLPPRRLSDLAQGLAALIDAAGLADQTPTMFFENQTKTEIEAE